MKGKTYLKLMSLVVVLSLLVNVPVPSFAVSKPKLNKTNVTLTIGHTTSLKLKNKKASVKWSSSKKSVATVSSGGTVTAKRAGTATIKAKSAKKTYKCKVTVPKQYISSTAVTLNVGDNRSLRVYGLSNDDDVFWSCDDESVATVSENGTITARKSGNTKVYANINYGIGNTYECDLTVYGDGTYYPEYTPKPSVSPSPSPTASPGIPVVGVAMSESNLSMITGGAMYLGYTIFPTNATNKNVKWSCTNERIVMISTSGMLVAISPGTAIVYVTTEDGGYISRCNVVVTAASPGPSVSPSPTVSPSPSPTVSPSPSPSTSTSPSPSPSASASSRPTPTPTPTSLPTPIPTPNSGEAGLYSSTNEGWSISETWDTLISGENPKITINSDKITQVDENLEGYLWIPANDSVTGIGDAAFSGCTELKYVSIPSGVTSIGKSAFAGCSALENVTIPDSVQTIGNNAFGGRIAEGGEIVYCSSLKKGLVIPNGVEDRNIGEYAFACIPVIYYKNGSGSGEHNYWGAQQWQPNPGNSRSLKGVNNEHSVNNESDGGENTLFSNLFRTFRSAIDVLFDSSPLRIWGRLK